MKFLISEDEDIAKAYKEYEHFSQDEELREIYESRMKWKRDQASRMKAARAEGRAEGKAEGRAEGKAEGRAEGKAEGRAEGKTEGITEVALNMLKAGLSIEQIADFTKLTQEEVQALSQKKAT